MREVTAIDHAWTCMEHAEICNKWMSGYDLKRVHPRGVGDILRFVITVYQRLT